MSIARHVSRAMLSRYSHVRMEARLALAEIAARQRAAEEKCQKDAEQQQPPFVVQSAIFQCAKLLGGRRLGECFRRDLLGDPSRGVAIHAASCAAEGRANGWTWRAFPGIDRLRRNNFRAIGQMMYDWRLRGGSPHAEVSH